MSTKDLRNKIASLDAFFAADTDDINIALANLEKLNDSESVRRRIALLLKDNRFDEAHSLTTTYPTHKDWIEIGIRAAILANDYELAEKFVITAGTLDDLTGTLNLRCIVSFADTVIVKHFSVQTNEKHPVSLSAVDPSIQPALQKGLDFLYPHCEAIFTRNSISTPLENEAISILQITLALLGRSDETNRFLPLLIGYGNINVLLGQFMADGYLPLISGFANVLIDSNPLDFDASLFAEIIKHLSGNNLQVTFNALLSLSTLADDDGKRAVLFSALSGISVQGGASFAKEIENHTDELLNLNKASDVVRLAMHNVYHKNWDKAETLLNKNQLIEDPQWLNASSLCDFERDNLIEGLDKLVSAALMYKDEKWLLKATDQAFQQENYSKAIECLKCIRNYYPWDTYARKNLISLFIRENLLDDAIEENEYLLTILTEDDQLIVQLAQLYNLTNKADKARIILTELIKKTPSLDALLLLGTILRQLGSPIDAFYLLDKHKDIYWENKEFLVVYLEMGYASGMEQNANEAFQALNTLREKGQIDPKLFRSASFDELKEIIHDSAERQNTANTLIIEGKMSWTMSGVLSHKSIYFEWKTRTQKIKWLAEDFASRASLSIYSTNAFGTETKDDDPRINRISTSHRHGNVCVDYSSLITLHALNKLSLLFSSYNTVFIPEQYRINIHKDRQSIQPHQLSHLSGYKFIRDLKDNDEIRIISDKDVTKYTVIDEYSDDNNKHLTRPLQSIINCLSKAGKINKSKENELIKIAHRNELENAQPLSINDQIAINLNTMMTIYREGVLNILASNFKLHITENDYIEITNDIRGFEFQKNTLKEFNDLWSEVSNYPNAKYVSVPTNSKLNEEGDHGIALQALKYSLDNDVALLADDRVLQSICINAKGSTNDVAYGTDVFLNRAFDDGDIDISDYASFTFQLMEWRYKFIVPDAKVLHYYVTLYTGTAPGEELSTTALYMHDCMRDPGLFGGLEKTEPPISMALKLYIEWARTVSTFMTLVWTDDNITDKRSESVTEWVAQIMIPSVPSVIQTQLHNKLASNLTEMLIATALIRASELPHHKRIATGLKQLSMLLGITDHRYEQLISEAVSRAAR